MKLIRLCTGMLAFTGLMLAPTMVRAAECHFDRSVPVSGGGSLDAGTGSGDMKIVPGDGSRVHIVGHAKSSSSWNLFGGNGNEGDVQRICDHPPIEQAGNSVKVGHVHSDWFQHVTVDYYIEVPRSFAVSANSGSGDVEVYDIGGTVSGTTGSGNVHARNLGAGAKLETGSGDIQAEGLSGDTTLGTGSGNIRANFQRSGEVRASTGSGDIQLENIAGGLTAHTGSGGVTVNGKPSSSWRIGTGSGDVKLQVPNGAGFNLDAETSSGDIKNSLPLTMQGSLGKHHVRGAVSGGGPELHVETSSGDIQID